MQVIVTRKIQDDHLAHAEDKKERKHKYYAKVEIKNNKFRYFYTKKDYNAYLNNQKKKKDKQNAFVIARKKVEKLLKKNASEIKKTSNSIKRKVNKLLSKIGNTPMSKAISSMSKEARNDVEKFVDNLFNKNKEKGNKVVEKKHKYVEKVKLPNGKYHYFYSEDEYDAYTKRLEYQKNEPDFMKHVKDISENDIYTAMEDMDKVNETYSPFDFDTSMNCCNCSVAYELRRRGYDVEASPATDSYNGRMDRVYEYFQDARYVAINEDGSNTYISQPFMTQMYEKGGITEKDATRYPNSYKAVMIEHTYTEQSLTNGILSVSPPGSRGFLDVSWKNGGGHSIVYEVTKSGNLIIRDSQTYDEYPVSELVNRISNAYVARTDNLQVKKNILDAVTTNKDDKRKYYHDDGHVYDANGNKLCYC